MGVYHITYAPELKEVCLYFNSRCNFSCYGCITDWHPEDCHLRKSTSTPAHQNTSLSVGEVISYLKQLSLGRVIFLGKEPTVDKDFLPLAKILKKEFSVYNILLTNGWEYVGSEVLDEICVSVKAITSRVFEEFTGKNNPERVSNNFRRYWNSGIKLRSESVFIPEFIDKEEIEKIAKFVSSVDSTIPYRIDAYIPHQDDNFRRPTEDEMEKAKSVAKKYLKNVSILHSKVRLKYKVEKVY